MTSPWEIFFREGINAFRSSDYEKALRSFDKAINNGGERYLIYDSRAAVYERLGNVKQALRDSRKAVELAPQMRHGYARSARLFFQQEKYQIALDMVQLALHRVKTHDTVHRLELETLQRSISEARDIRTAVEARNKPHFSKLPVELISEVFILATEMDNAFPACACLVCPQWRTIALSMSVLWQCVVLSDAHPVKKLSLWSERSQNRIMGLRIRADISRLQLRDALCHCGPDLSKTLKYVHSKVDMLMLSSCFMKIPNIQHLDLDDIELSVSRQKQIDRLTTSLTPLVPSNRKSSARSLIVEYIAVDWSAVIPRLSSLRTLIIRTVFEIPTTPLICKLLGANTHLEKMILETGCPMDLDSLSKDDRIVLPRLSHLELLGPMDARGLISRLSLPLLEHFAMCQSISAADQTLLALEPPSPGLTELSIRKCSFAEERLVSFLQRMSRLVRLEITHSGCAMDSVVGAIAGSNEAGREIRPVCPLLQHVDFSHCPSLNGGPIVRLVKPRLIDTTAATVLMTSPTAPSTRIKAVYIDGCPRIDPSVPEWLRSKVDKVSCVYMSKDEARKIRR